MGTNLEAAQHVGAELEKAVNATITSSITQHRQSLITAYLRLKKKARELVSPKPCNINMFFGCGGRI
jgi:hypothetical protein